MNTGSNTNAGDPAIRRIPSLNSAFKPYQQKAPPVPPKTEELVRKHLAILRSAPTPPPRPSLEDPPTPKPRTIFLQPHQYSTPLASAKSSASSLTLFTIDDITAALEKLPLPYVNRLTNAGLNLNRRQTTNVNETPVRQANPNVGRVVRSTSLSYLNPEPTQIRNSRTSLENSPPPDSGLHSASETITPPLKEVDPDFLARIQQLNALAEDVFGVPASCLVHPQDVFGIPASVLVQPQEGERIPGHKKKDTPLTGIEWPPSITDPRRYPRPSQKDINRKPEMARRNELARRYDNIPHPRNPDLPPDTSDFQRRLRILVWVETHFEDDGTLKIWE